jgi:hypothetical protein
MVFSVGHNMFLQISNDKMYNIINFYKSFIENFVNIFPNIILNKVNYNDVFIPNYMGFSKNHTKKLKKSVKDYYEKSINHYKLKTNQKTKKIYEQYDLIKILYEKYSPIYILFIAP